VELCSTCHTPFESDGHKTCTRCREQKRRYYQANRDRLIEYRRRYRQDNYDKIREWQIDHKEDAREYAQRRYWEKPEKRREASRTYHRANRERLLAAQYEYRQENQDKRRIYEQNRRARLRGNGGLLPTDAFSILFEEQEGRCYLCGELLYASFDDPVDLEHKVPVSRGGSNDLSNVGLAHSRCNHEKHTKTEVEFYASKGCS